MTTREKILDAMYELVAEMGYDKASIGKICDIIGISKPSVYYYFSSKEEIFVTLLDNMYPTLDYEADLSGIDDAKGFKSELQMLGRRIIEGYRDDEKRRRVLAEIGVQSTRIPAIAERQVNFSARIMGSLTKVLNRGIEIGALPEGYDAELGSQFLYSLLEGFSQTVAKREDIDEKVTWDYAVELMLS